MKECASANHLLKTRHDGNKMSTTLNLNAFFRATKTQQRRRRGSRGSGTRASRSAPRGEIRQNLISVYLSPSHPMG